MLSSIHQVPPLGIFTKKYCPRSLIHGHVSEIIVQSMPSTLRRDWGRLLFGMERDDLVGWKKHLKTAFWKERGKRGGKWRQAWDWVPRLGAVSSSHCFSLKVEKPQWRISVKHAVSPAHCSWCSVVTIIFLFLGIQFVPIMPRSWSEES